MIGSVTQEPSRHLLLPLRWTTSGSGKSVTRDKRAVWYWLTTGGKQKESLDNHWCRLMCIGLCIKEGGCEYYSKYIEQNCFNCFVPRILLTGRCHLATIVFWLSSKATIARWHLLTIAKTVLLYVFRIAFPASLLRQQYKYGCFWDKNNTVAVLVPGPAILVISLLHCLQVSIPRMAGWRETVRPGASLTAVWLPLALYLHLCTHRAGVWCSAVQCSVVQWSAV